MGFIKTIANVVVFIGSFMWASEYAFNCILDALEPDIPCSSSHGMYNKGEIWFSEYTETTATLKRDLLTNFTSCFPHLIPTHLQTTTLFVNEQIQYLSSDLKDCIDPTKILAHVQQEICDQTGLPFYLLNGPHNHWILLYNNQSSHIGSHVDNEFLTHGLTVGLTLDTGVESSECIEGSILTQSDKIAFIPHMTAPHHTPKVVEGVRIVYQIRGSPYRFDYPMQFMFRKIKNVAYVGVPSLFVPERFLTMFKHHFGGSTVYSVPLLNFSLSTEQQQWYAEFFSKVSVFLSHYVYYDSPRILQPFLLAVSVVTQLLMFYRDVFLNAYTILGVHLGQLLWMLSFKRTGLLLMYTSLWVGSTTSSWYIVGHVIILFLQVVNK